MSVFWSSISGGLFGRIKKVKASSKHDATFKDFDADMKRMENLDLEDSFDPDLESKPSLSAQTTARDTKGQK